MLLSSGPANAVNVAHGSIVSQKPASFTPNILDGRVNALLVMGNTVFVGGTFTQVEAANSSTILIRNYIFAFDATTGAISPTFQPALSGEVEALAQGSDGISVFAGGAFLSTNGNTTFRRLVRLNASNGRTIASFRPVPNRIVTDLVTRNGLLYASGEFTKIQGQAYSGLARLDQTTGVPDPNLNLPFTDPHIDPIHGGRMRVWRFDVTPDGSRLVAAGNFTKVGGVPRIQIAILDLSTTPVSVTSWETDHFPFLDDLGGPWCSAVFPWYIRGLDISPDGSYFAVSTTGANRIGHPVCDSLSRWETYGSGPQQPVWTTSMGGDTPETVMITGAAIYVGGHEQWVNDPYNPIRCGICPNPWPGGVHREGFEAHDPLNGLPFTWNPGRYPRGKGVLAMVSTPTGFFFGSDTDFVDGLIRRRLAFMPLSGGITIPPSDPYVLPGNFYTVNQTDSVGSMEGQTFDGTTFGSPGAVATGVDWSNVRGAFALNGNLYAGHADGTLTVQSFDGSNTGTPSPINLNGLDLPLDPMFTIPGTSIPIPTLSSHLSNMTGMAFDRGWLFYTVAGDPRLYERGFTPQSQVVGAPLLVASTGDGVDWANVRGMTIASGNLYFALTDGNLYKVAWSGSAPVGPVNQIAGAGFDGANWASTAMFAFGTT
jgi:hypothetical protein